jgi:hypothetical protein
LLERKTQVNLPVHPNAKRMTQFDIHSEFYDHPIRLKDEKPKDVIKNFFGAYKLSEIRAHLWNMVEVAITSENYVFDESRERDKLIWFYQQIEELIEAAYMISQKKVEKKFKKKNKSRK